MNFILDTNIFLYILKDATFESYFNQKFDFDNSENGFWTSVVVIGELESIALQRKWGYLKMKNLKGLLSEVQTLDINSEDIIIRYAEIDAFSQGNLDKKPLPSGISARNMGKNDLWIAATASVAKAVLISSDQDFVHLHQSFLSFEYIDLQNLSRN